MLLVTKSFLGAVSLLALSAQGATALFGAGTAGGNLLGAETDGMAMDFIAATPDLLIRDATTTLNYSGRPFAAGVAAGVAGDVGKLSFTRASLAMEYNSAGTLGFSGHNLILQSQTIDNASWGKTATTVVANDAAAPDGTTTAERVYPSTTGNDRYITQGIAKEGAALLYRISAYVKAAGINFVLLQGSNGANGVGKWFKVSDGTLGSNRTFGSGFTLSSSSITSVGSGWYLCTIEIVTDATTTLNLFMEVCDADNSVAVTANSTDGVHVWGLQLTRLPCADTNYYVTVASAVYKQRYDYNPDTLAARGLLIEEQRTNRALRSAEFDNASWVKSNVTVMADNAVGPFGTTTADLLTATASNGTVIQDLGVVGSAAKTGAVYIKRKTGTGNIDLTMDGGTGWTTKAVTTTWTRFDLTQTLANEDFGIRIVTSGDEIWVEAADVQSGAFMTSHIPTTTVAVTRSADQVSIATSLFPLNAATGAIVVSAETVDDNYTLWSLNNGSSERIQCFTSSAAIFMYDEDGGAFQFSTTFGVVTSSPFKAGLSWAASDFDGVLDGGTVVAENSGTIPTPVNLHIGCDHAGTTQLNGWIKQLIYLPRKPSNAELQAATA